MKRRIGLLLIMGYCLIVPLKAEKIHCPDQGIPILATEAKVDSFLAIYPNCEYVLSSFYSVDGVQIFWINNDPTKYLLFLTVVLGVILFFLEMIFRWVEWFQK